jgi:chromosome segregation ATPase
MAEESKTWDTWGTTPGGILYSLNPLDQARLLAVGFHHLIERLTRADVPIYLLAFPRFTEDSEYLFSTLKDCLPASIDADTAFAAHRSVVDLDKVRVAGELSGKGLPETTRKSPEHYPALGDIDNAALRREITKIRRSFADASESLRSAQADSSTLERKIEILQQEITSNQREIEHQRNVIEALGKTLESSQVQFKAIQSSTSWLLTSPIRWILGARS